MRFITVLIAASWVLFACGGKLRESGGRISTPGPSVPTAGDPISTAASTPDEPASLTSPEARSEVIESPKAPSIVEALTGTWSSPGGECYSGLHKITFRDSWKTMVHELSEPSVEFGKTLTYDVLQIHDDELEVSLRGETRRGSDGDPVRWALLYSGEARRYCWRRSDWKQNMCTAASKACESAGLNSWPREAELRVTEECTIALDDNVLFKALVAGQKRTVGEEDRVLVCQCNTYELRMSGINPESIAADLRDKVLRTCMIRHIVKERPMSARETCIAMIEAEGVPTERADEYCTCLTDVSDRTISASRSLGEVRNLTQECADRYLVQDSDSE